MNVNAAGGPAVAQLFFLVVREVLLVYFEKIQLEQLELKLKYTKKKECVNLIIAS